MAGKRPRQGECRFRIGEISTGNPVVASRHRGEEHNGCRRTLLIPARSAPETPACVQCVPSTNERTD